MHACPIPRQLQVHALCVHVVSKVRDRKRFSTISYVPHEPRGRLAIGSSSVQLTPAQN
jgi:hypothetical protein